MINIKLINASAGSGKTYNLTNRVVDLLKNEIEPEALMATTFTNRAAAELRERIRAELLKNHQPEEANRISDGFIGTVNSICGRLLKEYAIEAGLSPAIDIMPEEDSVDIFKISIDQVIDQFAGQIEPVAGRMELDGRGSGYQAKADWRDYVKRIVDLARSNRITPDQLKLCAQSSWETLANVLGDPVDKDFDEELHEAMKLAINHLEHIGKLTKTTQNSLATLKESSRRSENGRLTWSDWVRLAKLTAAKDGQDILDPVNIIADNVLSHPQFQADLKQLIDGTFDCAMEALKDYDAYKQEHGLMDFTDQETLVLDMAQNNESFQLSLKDRIKVLMVDEFQDTSPIQLSLFLNLNELAGKSVWVGDPKQAIYGFRGTDPQLMDEVVSLIGESSVLDCSWRSKEILIEFTNALFSEVFHEMGSDKVCLKVPPARAEKAKGGYLESWYLSAKNNAQESSAIANGVRDAIDRIAEIKPGDIAVLCRTNDNCIAIASSLEQLGIRASVGQGLLFYTRECRLALAALRYMNNPKDTLALVEIIQILSINDTGKDWLAELMESPDETKERWNQDEMLAALNEGRDHIKYWTPLEALEQAISRVNLIREVKAWSNPELALSNLDILRKNCHEYIDRCRSHRSAATVDGFISYMHESEAEQSKGFGEQTVNVLTYHKAKGLEWPWVILTDLNMEPKANVFGVNVEPAQHFDPSEPLANRSIRFWPWPFGSQKKYPALDDILENLPMKELAEKMAVREAQRLLYVGMTRAKEGLVLAVRNTSKGFKAGWLDALKDKRGDQVIELYSELGDQLIRVGTKHIPIQNMEYGPEGSELPGLNVSREEYLPEMVYSAEIYPKARISPSKLESPADSDNGKWERIENFNSRINIKGNPEMDVLGNTMHAYLAVNYKNMANEERLALAQSILENWGMADTLDHSEVVAAGQHLIDFIKARYPEHKTYTEWPIMVHNEKGQVVQGWIDMLLETEEGFVIIDHKNYPGKDAEERVKKYGPQLIAYKEAVERSTDKPVIDMLVHLPISGLILQLIGCDT